MDIREVGTPLTASQRRSYRETPDSGFYEAFKAAFEARAPIGAESATESDARALERVLGTTHTELSALRGVSTESQAAYAAVLNKAYSAGDMGNARGFLATLSAVEMEAVRRNHCLADPIDTASLSEEGAANLILPEGYSVNLNHDGVDEVGAARTVHFPPRFRLQECVLARLAFVHPHGIPFRQIGHGAQHTTCPIRSLQGLIRHALLWRCRVLSFAHVWQCHIGHAREVGCFHACGPCPMVRRCAW